jgi:cytochrome d ubiquinol oxidase subunit II
MAKVASAAWMALILLVLAVLSLTFFSARFLYAGILAKPFFWVTFIGFWSAILFVPVFLKTEKFGGAWAASAAAIICLLGLGFAALYPRLVPSYLNLSDSLTVYNASSTHRTLLVMFIIALIGMPLVIVYTSLIYRVFHGKVALGEESY